MSVFDPRTEVSADAKYITDKIFTYLLILFALPAFLGLLLWLFGVVK